MLQFSPVSQTITPPNKPELNGGLYTGEAFKGPWGNVPVIPDEIALTHTVLKLGNTPPPGATKQFSPYTIRPGNNASKLSPVTYAEDHLRLRVFCPTLEAAPRATPPSSFDALRAFAPLV